MFVGVYFLEITDGYVEIPFDVASEEYTAKCVKVKETGELYLKIVAKISKDVDNIDEEEIIFECSLEGNNVKIPEMFLNYISKDDVVCVIGMNDAINIISHHDYLKLENETDELIDELNVFLKDI